MPRAHRSLINPMSFRPVKRLQKLDIHPLTTTRWRDLETLFAAKGCSFARGCWCMDYRIGRSPRTPDGISTADFKRGLLRERATQAPAPGLIAYHEGEPVGWITVAPREDFGALARSKVMGPVDTTPVWSVVCFVVPSAWRRRGVATALLRGAIVHAARHGARWLEAYPIDKPGPSADNWLWHGTKAMFDRAGFKEILRRKPERPIMRRRLRPPVTTQTDDSISS
jgi:GNAT superfamily N-acetyltransferase